MKKFSSLIIVVLLSALVGSSALAYTVRPGDTLTRLARRNNSTVRQLVERNGIKNPDLIYVGQELDLGDEELVGITIPTVVALFETTLQSSISDTATSMTLVSATDKDGNSLSGAYGFVIDEGTTSEEFVTASCTGTSCTSLVRGISVVDGKTSVTALKKSHRKGASVKITDFPILGRLARILNGQEASPAKLYVESGLTITSSTELTTKAYVDGVAFAGAPDATETSKGIFEQATGLQAASSTLLDNTTAPLAITTKYTTTTPYTTGNWIPVTKNNGKLDTAVIDQGASYTWSALNTFTATTTFATTTMASSTISTVNSTRIISNTVTSTVVDTGTICFSGANCGSSFSGLLDTASTTAAGNLTGTNTTAAGTYSEAVTVGFRPKVIILNYYVQGHDTSAGNNNYLKNQGQVFYVGLDAFGGFYTHCDEDTADNVCEYEDQNTLNNGEVQLYYGNDLSEGTSGGGNEDISMTVSISAISATGFTFQCVSATGAGSNSSVARCAGSWAAFR